MSDNKIRKNRIKYIVGVCLRYSFILTFAIWAIIDSSNYKEALPSLFWVLNSFGIIMIGVSIFGFLENTGLLKKWFPKSKFGK